MKTSKNKKQLAKLGTQFEKLSVELVEITAKRDAVPDGNAWRRSPMMMREWLKLFRKIYH